MPERSEEPLGSRMEADVKAVQPQLTDEQWLLISDFFPVSERDLDGRESRESARTVSREIGSIRPSSRAT